MIAVRYDDDPQPLGPHALSQRSNLGFAAEVAALSFAGVEDEPLEIAEVIEDQPGDLAVVLLVPLGVMVIMLVLVTVRALRRREKRRRNIRRMPTESVDTRGDQADVSLEHRTPPVCRRHRFQARLEDRQRRFLAREHLALRPNRDSHLKGPDDVPFGLAEIDGNGGDRAVGRWPGLVHDVLYRDSRSGSRRRLWQTPRRRVPILRMTMSNPAP